MSHQQKAPSFSIKTVQPTVYRTVSKSENTTPTSSLYQSSYSSFGIQSQQNNQKQNNKGLTIQTTDTSIEDSF